MKALGVLLLVACPLVVGTTSSRERPRTAEAVLHNSAGLEIGTATFVEVRGAGLKISLDVHGLPPGLHGFHIHSGGKCDPPDFASAGPHFNPDDRQHGLKNPQGPHAGDLGNLLVAANGWARVVILDPRLSLTAGRPNSLTRPGGTSIVIHAQPDDEVSDPTGHSGVRIACGIIVN